MHLGRDGFGLEPRDVVVAVGGHRGEGVRVGVRLGCDGVGDRHVHGDVLRVVPRARVDLNLAVERGHRGQVGPRVEGDREDDRDG